MHLKGKTISLRDWQLKDLEIYRHWNTGHFRWMDFNGPYYPNLTKNELEAQITALKSRIETNDWPIPRKKLVIFDHTDDKMIGDVSWYWQSQETNWLSIGLAIYDEKNWSKGLGFQALSLWISYLFQANNDLVRMDLRTWSGNHGMMKLAEKLGFKEEARFRKARIVKGEYYDSIGMGILREEWESVS